MICVSGDVSFAIRNVPYHNYDRRTLLKTVDTLRDRRNVPNTTVGEFSYMAYDNLGSEAGK